MPNSWEDELTIDDIPDQYRGVVEIVGVKAFFRLATYCGGIPLYLPKPDKMIQAIRNRRIRAEFNGYNVDVLARRYRLTSAHIRNIVANEDATIPGQVSLFDFTAKETHSNV